MDPLMQRWIWEKETGSSKGKGELGVGGLHLFRKVEVKAIYCPER